MQNLSENLTVAELDKLIESIAHKEAQIEGATKVLATLNLELAQLEGKAVNYLRGLNRAKYDSPHGKVSIEEKWRVNLPADDKAKKALFEHLRTRGIFDKYATVNSNSLNSLYMADWAEAKARDEGMTFNMPGIEAPKLFEKLKFKAAKK